MDNEPNDVKPEAEEPSPSAGDTTAAPPTGATVTETPDDKGPQSIADVVAATVDKHAKAESAAESDSTIEPDKKEAEATEDAKAESEKRPVPYERFSEVNEKFRTAEAKVAELEPLAKLYQQNADYLTQNGVTPEEYQQAIDFVVLAKNDPASFATKLKAMVEQLGPTVGDVLPADLQKSVDAGDISLEYAQRLARAEATTKLNSQRAQKATAQTAEQRQAAMAQRVNDSVTSWLTTKAKSDPDFLPKKPGEKDGKREAFEAKVALLCSQRKIASPEDAVAMLNEAYESVNGLVSRFTPRVNGARTLRSGQSSRTTPEEPQTVKDVVLNIARRHGYPG